MFFEDAFVPDDLVLGGVDQGWSVAMATTGSERGLTLRSPGRFTAAARRLIDLAPTSGPATRSTRDPAPGRARPTSTPRRTGSRRCGPSRARSRGDPPGAESSLTKVFWSELDVRIHEAALALLGHEAELEARRG